jgi:NTE family protein
MAGVESATSTKRTEVVLVLQGGGALGAYEYGGILGLFDAIEATKNREITIKAVTGVSIGAVNAACVVGANDRNDARERLLKLWNDFAIRAPFLSGEIALLGVPNFYTFWPTLTALYDTDKLLTTLAKHVCFETLNRSATIFIVTAVDVESGELTWFANQKVGDVLPTTITAKHVLASGSLAPQFPWTDVADGREPRHYWDGGIVDNTPLGAAIDAFTPEEEIDRFLVVMNLFPLKADRPVSFAQVNDRVNQLRFGNRLRQDVENAKLINKMISMIERLAPFAPQPLQREAKEKFGRFKQVKTVQISLSEDEKYFDMDGFRDFSFQGIEARREKGREIAFQKVTDEFNNPPAAA